MTIANRKGDNRNTAFGRFVHLLELNSNPNAFLQIQPPLYGTGKVEIAIFNRSILNFAHI